VNAAADIILAAGTITVANELVFAPVAGSKIAFNWRVLPATGIAALLVDAISKLSPPLAMGIAITTIVTVIFGSFGNAASPVTNLATAMGYKT
jgi:hypothetical protein